MGGTLVFRGTRVPAQSLLDYLQDGYSLDEFLAMFPSVAREDATLFLELACVAKRPTHADGRATRNQVEPVPDTEYKNGRHFACERNAG